MKTSGVSGSGLIAYAEQTQLASSQEDQKTARARRQAATQRATAAAHERIEAANQQAGAELDGAKKANTVKSVFVAIGAACAVAALAAAAIFTFGALAAPAALAAGTIIAGAAAIIAAGGLATGAAAATGGVLAQSAKNAAQKVVDEFADQAMEAELATKQAEEQAADAKDAVQIALDRKRRVLEGMKKRDDQRPRSWLTNA